MTKYQTTEVIGSFIFIVLGIMTIVNSSTLEYRSEYGPGPGFMPLWLGIIITIVSVINLLASIRKLQLADDTSERLNILATFKNNRRAYSVFGALAVTILLFQFVGFLIASSLFYLFVIFFVEQRPVVFSLIFSVVATGLFYVIFKFALGVPLP